MRKKLLYIANMRVPTEKAHGVHIFKMCEAFARAGADVELVVPRRRNPLRQDPYEYYGVERLFPIRYAYSLDLIHLADWLGFWLQTLSYTFVLALRYLFSDRRALLIYTREHQIAVAMRALGYETVYEAHRVLGKKALFFGLLRGLPRIVTNSEGVAREFRERGFPRVLALPNGVDMREFSFTASKDELRRELGLPLKKRIVMYTGHLYAWKGIAAALGAARELGGEYEFVFAGGTPEDVEACKKFAEGIGNVRFVGHVPKRAVARYLRAADVLILPNSSVSEESIKYTSPMKVFEYMAAEQPIVASDLPSVREILNEKNAILVPPDDARALAEGIRRTVEDTDAARARSARARKDVKTHTWGRRAEAILEFIGMRLTVS